MIDVVVVEPAAAVRDGLASLMRAAAGVRVVAVSADADAALRSVVRQRPSVVLVAAEMSGAAALTRAIMTEAPTPVIVVVDPASASMAAPVMAEGAVGVQPRPRDAAGARRFQAVVVALAEVSVVRRRRTAQPGSSTPGPTPERAVTPGRVVGVAASTGGPAALQELFSRLPRSLPVPVVVVQHIVAGFVGGLVASLQVASPLPIQVARDGEALAPGTVYVAADEQHLSVTPAGRARLDASPPVGGYRPSATVLFTSIAAAYGASAIAVVLTGMGTDGLAGLHDVRRAGGQILVQDERSSVVYGMPGAAVEAGIADLTASVTGIAQRVTELTQEEQG